MAEAFKSKHSFTFAVILFYLLPIVSLAIYGMNVTSPQRSWGLFACGLFLGVIGTFFLTFMYKGEEHIPHNKEPINSYEVPSRSPPGNDLFEPFHSSQNFEEQNNLLEKSLLESEEKVTLLTSQINIKNEELQKLEQELKKNQIQYDFTVKELENYKKVTQSHLDHSQVILDQNSQTIKDQKEIIETTKKTTEELEIKIHDLNYEIKTLLQLTEINSSTSLITPKPYQKDHLPSGLLIKESLSKYQSADVSENSSTILEKNIDVPEEGTFLLRRCLDIAQKITGANHFSINSSRYRDMSIDNYALDLRRLFDSLRSENSCGVIVYSQKENKVLFANNQTKNLLGWGPEKFVQNFHEIIQTGYSEWKNGLSQLACKKESNFPLLIKTKSGQDISFQCHLGIIPSGLFRNNVIGVFY
jgi:PAS domain-containing protein